MAKSITYYLTLLVIKLKGVKKNFQQDPVDYVSLRKDDVIYPKGNYFKSVQMNHFTCDQTEITEITTANHAKKLLIYVHGGAFVSGPSQHHWDAIQKISILESYTCWMCKYPKAPAHKISTMNENLDLIFKTALEKYSPENIVLMGDSAGGTLIVTLVQRLIELAKKLPNKLILISPVLDASFQHSAIDNIDKTDPMLAKKGVLSAKKMCSEDGNLTNKMISPNYGSVKGFPTTYLFLAENDITYPDQLLFLDKLTQEKVEHYPYFGKGMPHIWPLLPVMKEAKVAFNQVVQILQKD